MHSDGRCTSLIRMSVLNYRQKYNNLHAASKSAATMARVVISMRLQVRVMQVTTHQADGAQHGRKCSQSAKTLSINLASIVARHAVQRRMDKLLFQQHA
eukprot:6183400-Pleurochrysis_carterae.AAC.3